MEKIRSLLREMETTQHAMHGASDHGEHRRLRDEADRINSDLQVQALLVGEQVISSIHRISEALQDIAVSQRIIAGRARSL